MPFFTRLFFLVALGGLLSFSGFAGAADVPFGSQQVISTLADFALSVASADIDGDGDLDVLSASQTDDKIAWYENTDGAGSFGAQQVITTAADFASEVASADIDGDGDLDVLSASEFDDKIAWYENIGGAATFGAQQVITTLAWPMAPVRWLLRTWTVTATWMSCRRLLTTTRSRGTRTPTARGRSAPSR